jgi:nucleotide-binding universal stress UspA family protein
MFKRMVVPLDGSALAEGVLPAAAQLARALKIPIALLNVIPEGALPRQVAAHHPETIDQMLDQERTGALAYLGAHRAQLEAQGLTVTVDVQLMDHAADGIVHYAAAQPDTLIAMSTRGRTGIQRLVMGSVGDRVLQTTRGPLLLFRPPQDAPAQGFQHVLIPLDQSDLAEQALPLAEALARELDLPLTLVYVQPPSAMVFADPTTGAYAPIYLEMEEEAEQVAAAYLDTQAAGLRARGIRLGTSLRHGRPAHEIAAAAGESPGSLIVMSTHGRTGVGRAILGSVASAVVRESGAPVLLIRAGAAP